MLHKNFEIFQGPQSFLCPCIKSTAPLHPQVSKTCKKNRSTLPTAFLIFLPSCIFITRSSSSINATKICVKYKIKTEAPSPHAALTPFFAHLHAIPHAIAHRVQLHAALLLRKFPSSFDLLNKQIKVSLLAGLRPVFSTLSPSLWLSTRAPSGLSKSLLSST